MPPADIVDLSGPAAGAITPPAWAPSHQACTYVAMAHSKAVEIVRYVETHGCDNLQLEILVQEMREFLPQELGDLGGNELLPRQLAKCKKEQFERTIKAVKAAIREVASFDLSDVGDVELKTLAKSLSLRLAQLSGPSLVNALI